MKKVIFINVLILLFYSSLSYGHSGGTDSNGGHHVTATGEYHYHHGYPAHDHINGLCLCLDENTDEISKDNSNNSSNDNSGNNLLPVIAVSGLGMLIITSNKKRKSRKW